MLICSFFCIFEIDCKYLVGLNGNIGGMLEYQVMNDGQAYPYGLTF